MQESALLRYADARIRAGREDGEAEGGVSKVSSDSCF